ncbi:hypothetical protein BDDG_03277 [Blastomyces dermatitidis ATCC 18188]|uniref:Uncharacterized protein n=1 Tax=Ajellomyces dermatitidis (strain ATCC 18188 / CBS 674.68) TaxID=653446 RepID=F2TAS3_AJEDA|nr:hypothetical protein BDDG_03277 [Blastomyces dermatitidis ATCC 18188]
MTRSLLIAILSLSLPLALATDDCGSGGVDCPTASLGRTPRSLSTAYSHITVTVKTMTPRGAPKETFPSAALGPPLAASEPPAAASPRATATPLKTAPAAPAYPAKPPKPGAGESVKKPKTARPAAPKPEPEYEAPSQKKSPPQRQSPPDYEAPPKKKSPAPKKESPPPKKESPPDYQAPSQKVSPPQRESPPNYEPPRKENLLRRRKKPLLQRKNPHQTTKPHHSRDRHQNSPSPNQTTKLGRNTDAELSGRLDVFVEPGMPFITNVGNRPWLVSIFSLLLLLFRKKGFPSLLWRWVHDPGPPSFDVVSLEFGILDN